MSWNLNFVGKPKDIVTAIESFGNKLSDQSKEEFDAAKPHLIALVNQNYGENRLLKVIASGSGYTPTTGEGSRNLTVSIEQIYAEVV